MCLLIHGLKNFGILLCIVELPHSEANSQLMYLLIKILFIQIN